MKKWSNKLPKIHVQVEPRMCPYFGNRCFADMIGKVKVMSRWIRVGPKSNNGCPSRFGYEDSDVKRDTEIRVMRLKVREGQGVCYSPASRMRQGHTLPCRIWREHSPNNTLTLDF